MNTIRFVHTEGTGMHAVLQIIYLDTYSVYMDKLNVTMETATDSKACLS